MKSTALVVTATLLFFSAVTHAEKAWLQIEIFEPLEFDELRAKYEKPLEVMFEEVGGVMFIRGNSKSPPNAFGQRRIFFANLEAWVEKPKKAFEISKQGLVSLGAGDGATISIQSGSFSDNATLVQGKWLASADLDFDFESRVSFDVEQTGRFLQAFATSNLKLGRGPAPAQRIIDMKPGHSIVTLTDVQYFGAVRDVQVSIAKLDASTVSFCVYSNTKRFASKAQFELDQVIAETSHKRLGVRNRTEPPQAIM